MGYRVIAGGYLLHDDNLQELKVSQAKLSLELNKTGSFEFVIYPEHTYYNTIAKIKTIVEVYQDNTLLFRGRVLEDVTGFLNEKHVICEGELAFLIDSIQRPYSFSGSVKDYFTMLINSHNSQVENEKQFTIGNTPTGSITAASADYTSVWDELNNKLLNEQGGYLWIRHENGINYIDYLQTLNRLSSQTIEFGRNLIDLKKIRKGEDVATALIPLGAKTDSGRLTIESVNSGRDYIYDSAAVNANGWIYKTVVFDDITTPEALLAKGKAQLALLVNFAESVELTAADLAKLETNINSFSLGSTVNVYSEPHRISQNFLVSKLSIDLLNPEANKLTLGGKFESFTQQSQIKVIKGIDGRDGKDGKDGTAGAKGDKGDKGDAGATGKGIKSIAEYYLASALNTGVTTSTSGWSTAIPTITETNKYLWNYEAITYTDNSSTTIAPRIIGVYGERGANGSNGANGKDGKGIASTVVAYQAGSSGTTAPTGTWSATIPTVAANQYLWTRTIINYTDNTASTVYAIGKMGANGATGATGNGIRTITNYYLATTASSGVTTATSGWTTTVQSVSSSKKYLWNYEQVAYTDGSSQITQPVIIGAYGDKGDKGDTGARGATGAAGKDAAVQSLTEPVDKTYLWLDISLDPPQMKRYNPETAKWVIVNDIASVIYNLERNLESDITKTEESIKTTVAEKYTLKDEANSLVSEVSTNLEQTARGFNIQFSQFSANVADIAARTDAEFELMRQYIRFANGQILLGKVGSALELRIANDRVSFLQSGAEVAYLSNNRLYVTDGNFINSLQLGEFAFIPRNNGNLSFKRNDAITGGNITGLAFVGDAII